MPRLRTVGSGGRISPPLTRWETRSAVSIPIFCRDPKVCLWEATFLRLGQNRLERIPGVFRVQRAVELGGPLGGKRAACE